MIRVSHLLDHGSLARRHREIVILRTVARCSSECDWRVRVALLAGHDELRETEMAAIAYGGASDPAWSQCERTLVRLVDELHDTARISDTLWTELRRHWSPAQLAELLALVGIYHAISFALNGLGVERELPAAPTSRDRILEAEPEVTRT